MQLGPGAGHDHLVEVEEGERKAIERCIELTKSYMDETRLIVLETEVES